MHKIAWKLHKKNTNVIEYVIVMTSCEYFQAVEIGNTTGPKKSGILKIHT